MKIPLNRLQYNFNRPLTNIEPDSSRENPLPQVAPPNLEIPAVSPLPLVEPDHSRDNPLPPNLSPTPEPSLQLNIIHVEPDHSRDYPQSQSGNKPQPLQFTPEEVAILRENLIFKLKNLD